jgi:hypothetical protein
LQESHGIPCEVRHFDEWNPADVIEVFADIAMYLDNVGAVGLLDE